MINYWWVTRPKRKLNSIPDVLATFSEMSLDQEWQGQRESHLSLEEALEKSGLKRIGERRDQTGGGGRTYKAWVESLGLIFTQESTGKIKLTLAGEAIMNGESPVQVLKGQILKYQFPSSYSIGRGVDVSRRFKIRPFIFLLKLLSDDRIKYLRQDEIAKIVIVDAENESNKCYEEVINKVISYRTFGDVVLESDFFEKYKSSKGAVNPEYPFRHLTDIANTMLNWLEYTQLVKRSNGEVRILVDKMEEVSEILSNIPPFIDRPEEHEYFQRKYGLDPRHKKDTRNMIQSKTITAGMIAEHKIKQAFIGESLKKPITKIDSEIIQSISLITGVNEKFVEETLLKQYPNGSIGAFMTEYFEMAFKGRDNATEFEMTTVEIFKDVFGFDAEHVGPIPLNPDVYVISKNDGFCGILDTKAYHNYSINNDHRNRMVHNYIETYSNKEYPLAFFSYISGGFGSNINSQVKSIVDETKVNGSAMSVSNMIYLIEKFNELNMNHGTIRRIFSINRQVLRQDIY